MLLEGRSHYGRWATLLACAPWNDCEQAMARDLIAPLTRRKGKRRSKGNNTTLIWAPGWWVLFFCHLSTRPLGYSMPAPWLPARTCAACCSTPLATHMPTHMPNQIILPYMIHILLPSGQMRVQLGAQYSSSGELPVCLPTCPHKSTAHAAPCISTCKQATTVRPWTRCAGVCI